MNQLNNPVTFSGKAIRSEEFFNQMVEALDIIIDKRPKGSSRKMESQTIEKIGCVVVPISIKIEGGDEK